MQYVSQNCNDSEVFVRKNPQLFISHNMTHVRQITGKYVVKVNDVHALYYHLKLIFEINF